jgi:hypothetical protein
MTFVPLLFLLAASDAQRVETPLFELRLEEIRSCGDGSWLGVAVRARAKSNEMFVTARDFSLEKGGVILQGRHVDPPRLPRCSPLLSPKELRANQSLRGFVLFEVPASFRRGDVPLVLAYHPTRWGGARRVEFRVPACLDTCPDLKTAARKPAQR